jgi:hypothetical protein
LAVCASVLHHNAEMRTVVTIKCRVNLFCFIKQPLFATAPNVTGEARPV